MSDVHPVIADAARRAVLTVWGGQERPFVLAPRVELGRWWLVQNDEVLTKSQGSYADMIVTARSINRLRGWHGMLVILRAERSPEPSGWQEALDVISTLPGISTWTEVLP